VRRNDRLSNMFKGEEKRKLQSNNIIVCLTFKIINNLRQLFLETMTDNLRRREGAIYSITNFILQDLLTRQKCVPAKFESFRTILQRQNTWIQSSTTAGILSHEDHHTYGMTQYELAHHQSIPSLRSGSFCDYCWLES